jgi:hypothetical protein
MILIHTRVATQRRTGDCSICFPQLHIKAIEKLFSVPIKLTHIVKKEVIRKNKLIVCVSHLCWMIILYFASIIFQSFP